MPDDDRDSYRLAGELYLLPTPAGAYQAVSGNEQSKIDELLLALLRQRSSPLATPATVSELLGMDDQQAALEVLHQAQTLTWIEGFDEPREAPSRGVGTELVNHLPHLSSTDKGMLVDWNGLPLASCGIDEETGDTLAALAADLIGVQERHAARLARHLGRASHAWAAVDAYGSSRIGAWPLYIGDKRVLLVLLGEPLLNHASFVAMAWLLMRHYG